MKRLISLATAAGLTLGGIGMIGCQSSDTTPQAGHNAQFSGGSGEFGTTPALAGDYQRDLPQQPATQPAPAAH